MSKTHQKIELVANILIIVVAIAIGGIIVQKYFFTSTSVQSARVKPTVGDKMELADVNFSQQQKTLILALQSTCGFCNESAPFYKRVVETVRDKSIKLVAVFPSSVEESALHLKKLGLPNMEVRESSLNSLQVSGTPTLILTNDKGEITNYWVGKLTPEKETEVISQLQN